MILTDAMIKETVKKGIIKIDPFDLECIQPATFDLRVGKEGLTTEGREKVDIERKGMLLLEPGDFGVVSTLEIIEMPADHAARIGIRSYYSRQGLFAATGPQVDPGFRGRLFITVINLSPNSITLPYKEKFVSLEIHKLNEAVEKPYIGEFQDRLMMSDREIRSVIDRKGVTFSEMIRSMNGINHSIGQLTADVRSLKWIIPTLIGSGLAIISILLAIVAFK